MEARVAFNKVSLAPLDKRVAFQDPNLEEILSITSFKTIFDLKLAPKGRPRYVDGKKPILHPRIQAKPSIFGTDPT